MEVTRPRDLAIGARTEGLQLVSRHDQKHAAVQAMELLARIQQESRESQQPAVDWHSGSMR